MRGFSPIPEGGKGHAMEKPPPETQIGRNQQKLAPSEYT